MEKQRPKTDLLKQTNIKWEEAWKRKVERVRERGERERERASKRNSKAIKFK
jgi:hypothetical protein